MSYMPAGSQTLTPYLVLQGAAEAIDFYTQVFGAEELHRMPGPDGKIMHAELKIGDSPLFVADEMPGWDGPKTIGGSPVSIHIWVEDTDATMDKATAAGATVTKPAEDAFWGARHGLIQDPFGHAWSIATHQKDMTPEEVQAAAAEWFDQQGG